MISIQVAVDPHLEGPALKIVRLILSTVLKSEGTTAAKVSLVFGGDELLAELKKEYFHVDQLTDVIAFRLNAKPGSVLEGEIYISLPRAQENSHLFREPYAREVARLIIHGGLHLLNYSDSDPGGKKQMRSKEDTYLEQVAWDQLFN